MAEGSSENLPKSSIQECPGKDDSILNDEADRLLELVIKQYKDESNEPTQTESRLGRLNTNTADELARLRINPNFYEYTKIGENGLLELDIDKLERKMWPLDIDEISEVDPCQKENNVKILKDAIADSFKLSAKSEDSPQQKEQEKSTSNKKKMLRHGNKKKSKFGDRNPILKMSNESCLRNLDKSIEDDLKCFNEELSNYGESDLNPAVNILRRIGYPKKHFSPEFPNDAYVEDEPVENIAISMEHFEFLHEETSYDFLEIVKNQDIKKVAADLENDVKINDIVPSFIEFLKTTDAMRFHLECFIIILAVIKNPYRKVEYYYDPQLPVVKEQTAFAEYLINCLVNSLVLNSQIACEKLTETFVVFANVHNSFHALILAGLEDLLCEKLDDKLAYQVYSKVLNIMVSIGPTLISLCLPKHFKIFSSLAKKNANCELYFCLLRASEILIVDAIENESQIEMEPTEILTTDKIENESQMETKACETNRNKSNTGDLNVFDLKSFLAHCYNYFGYALNIRLMPAFRKYIKRKDREEQYLSQKHAMFPTKDGYMNLKMQFLIKKNRNLKESESLNFPSVKQSSFNSTGKILNESSNIWAGYRVQEDSFALNDDDAVYFQSIDDIALYYLER